MIPYNLEENCISLICWQFPIAIIMQPSNGGRNGFGCRGSCKTSPTTREEILKTVSECEENMKVSSTVTRKKSVPININEIKFALPRPDKIFVRMTTVGLCHTDTAFQHGPMALSRVLAYEGTGVVEEVGDKVTKVKPGDHVVLTHLSCGQCIPCQKGYPSYCLRIFTPTTQGGRSTGNNEVKKRLFLGRSLFGTYAAITERNVVKVRSDVELEMLGPLGSSAQIGAGAVFNHLHVKGGSSIAIFGLGSVGLSAVMAAVVSSCSTIIGVDLHPERLKMAKRIGATHTIDAARINPLEVIKMITGSGVDYSVESTAHHTLFRQAAGALNRMGTCGLVGCAKPGAQVTFDINYIPFGRTICGITDGGNIADVFIPQLIDLYLQGNFPVNRLITFYEANKISQAIEDLTNGKVINPVIRMR